MKRGQRNNDIRPEVSRRRKPCSKIEAKLRSRRRGKLDNEEKKSPRLKKRGKNSSSESDVSPRLFTSKQHVELVNFEPRKFVPLFRKYSQNMPEKCEYDVKFDEKTKNLCKSQLQSFAREELNSKKIRNSLNVKIENSDEKIDAISNLLKNRSKNLFDYFYKKDLKNDEKSIEKNGKASNLMKNHSKKEIEHLSKKELNESKILDNLQFNKRRSRSAPCTPLFKIKYSKDKFSQNLFVDGKSLVDNAVREKIRKYRKNAPSSLRISRSGDVLISSSVKSSNGEIIERTSFEEIEKKENFNELFLLTKNSQKFQPDEETNFFKHEEENKTTEEERIEATGENDKLDEKIESKECLEVALKNSEILENGITIPIANVEIRDETNITTDIEIVETISLVVKKSLIKKESRIIEEKSFSPRKFPKKREFKWETLLEKQHRQLASLSPENCKKSTEIIEKTDDDRFKFCTAKTANISKKKSSPKSRNSFEEKNYEAYSVIKEELPKLLAKRQILDAMKSKKNDSQEITKNFRQSDKLNSQISKNSTIISGIMKSYYEQPERTRKEICRCKKLNFENSAENCDLQKNNSSSVVEVQKNRRTMMLERRKSPSPRRVTFRLPGRVIGEKSSQEEIYFAKNMMDEEEIELGKNQASLKGFIEKSEDDEKDRNFRENNKLRKHDGLLNFCIQEKARRFHAENSSNCRATKNLSIPPRFYAPKELENFHVSEDSEQDWETPTSEDIYRASKEVKFPKETREAMKILLRAKENVRRDHLGRLIVRQSFGEISRELRSRRPAEIRRNDEAKSRIREC